MVSAAWLALAGLAAFKQFLQALLRPPDQGPVGWGEIVFESGDWLLLAFLTPAVFWLARRYPLSRATLKRYLPLHIALSLGLCFAWAGAGTLLSWLVFGNGPWGGPVGWLLTTLPFGVAVYFAMLGIEHGAFYFLEARAREMQAARLQAQLAEARLGALRMQLQPHFLFNSLNAITVIVRDRDTATATRMLEQLGDMLRRVIKSDRPQLVPLADELAFVRQYLGIEQVRYSDRLQPVFAVDDALLQALVPEFLLQPLVENALRHGLAMRTGATLLRVEARREGDQLVLAIIDDGPGPEGERPANGEGVGLANTRERLATLYGEHAGLTLERSAQGGAAAIVRLPYREAGAASG